MEPRPPRKGSPILAKDFAWLFRRARRKFRGGPGIRIREDDNAVTISAIGGNVKGGGGGAFLNPGFHVELTSEAADIEGYVRARLWGGYVESFGNHLALFVDNPTAVEEVFYGTFGSGPIESLSTSTSRLRQVATYASATLGLDDSDVVDFDPDSSFYVYLEITHCDTVSDAVIKTISAGSIPADTPFGPESGSGTKNLEIARWDTALQKFVIQRRGTIYWVEVYGTVTSGT
jgi:hypothetical protein